MYTYKATVIRIVDGDSIRMSISLGFGCHLFGTDGRGMDIRLFGREVELQRRKHMGYWRRHALKNTSRSERRMKLRRINEGSLEDT